ncbi:hypothetical protein [Streptomyces sp. V1I6]|uniref:hypothetical protein n=1 Tax=Streptomyces sp. V1I6 TaxID=3042273 RepID=UPI0027898522|nr:hypothetical protein [Streptomyces sp. V1I6]MDQ0847286.1 hypothetical protein [Streptomyces sp. V1I6]
MLDDPRVTAQMLVGTTVVRVGIFGSPQYVNDDRPRQLAAMFAERSRTPQDHAARSTEP